ncbi:MAG: phosphatase PAP2 family protein, partial [Wenzhouxiangellaceae bacterium]|nr:phosphatase PAP2 family protein [Wenzhouxiangellaceae bacterium]
MNTTFARALSHLEQVDRRACTALNRLSRHRPVRALFATASRLGDGVVWYSLMALMALMQGEYGVRAASVMAVTGLTGLGLYKLMKTRLVRERPFVSHTDILLGGRPLDRHSFPSGHTLHAVAFTIIAVAWFPALAGVLVP